MKQSDAAESKSAPRFLSVSQTARMVGVSTMTLYRAIAAGEFPAVRIRGRLVVPIACLEAMADAATEHQSVVDATVPVPRGAGR